MPTVERIQCLVRMNYDGNAGLTTVLKSGPSAAYAFEIPLIRRMNDLGMDVEEADCCITEAEVVGEVTMTRDEIRAYMRRRYKLPLIDALYPGGRGYALTLADCELPDTSLVRKPEKDYGPININTSDRALLRTLKGVSEARALAIVEQGPWESVDQLSQIEGISQNMIDGWMKSPGLLVIPIHEDVS